MGTQTSTNFHLEMTSWTSEGFWKGEPIVYFSWGVAKMFLLIGGNCGKTSFYQLRT